MINLNHLPSDVAWVWGIQWSKQPVGLDMWQEMKAIIKANPSYFPWETLYDSIPESVHDAYRQERHAETEKLWQKMVNDGGSFKGLIPTILEMKPYEPPQGTWQQIISAHQELQKQKEEAERARFKKEKTLWDKYYKNYGLEYRE